MIQSIIVAFSMYSKIPMPKIMWNQNNMKYALCFFPFVGIVISIVEYLAFWLCKYLEMGTLFTSCVATLIPVLLTGGIHLDGYLDTIDALSSYQDTDKKLEILKDSNSGAFAIIYGLVYVVASIGIWSELEAKALPYICIAYVCSRTMSAFSIASFPLAKKTGLAATFQDGAHKRNVKICMILYFMIETLLLLYLSPIWGVSVLVACFLAFFLHRYICMSKFGGITGDLAGFFLQLCEILVLFTMLVLLKMNV